MTRKTSGARRKTRNKRAASAGPCIRSRYLGEPRLVFADGREDVDPKLGISRIGPKSWRPERRHPSSLRVGFIGPPDAIELAQRWLEPVRKFRDRKTVVRRIWEAVQKVDGEAGQPAPSAAEKRPRSAHQASKAKPRATGRRGTKSERVLALLRQPGGATLKALMRQLGRPIACTVS